MVDKNHSTEHQSFSCMRTAERLAPSARASSKYCFEEAPSQVVEHVETCSTTSTEEKEDLQLRKAMKAFVSPKRYPDEPDIDLMVLLERIEAQEKAEKERKRQRQQWFSQLFKASWPLALLGGSGVVGLVLIISLPAYSNIIGTLLVLVQCLLMVLPTLIKREKGLLSKKEETEETAMQKEHPMQEKRQTKIHSLRR